jgi:hypothetical protein
MYIEGTLVTNTHIHNLPRFSDLSRTNRGQSSALELFKSAIEDEMRLLPRSDETTRAGKAMAPCHSKSIPPSWAVPPQDGGEESTMSGRGGRGLRYYGPGTCDTDGLGGPECTCPSSLRLALIVFLANCQLF